MKIKNICTAKETVTRLKRQLRECKKIFSSYPSDRGLTTRIHKELKN
jgi:hypothetical protein